MLQKLLRKGALLSALSCILLTACNKGNSSSWALINEPKRGNKCSQLSFEPSFKGGSMGLQMLKTEKGLITYLNLYTGQFPSDDAQTVTVYLKCGETKHSYKAHLLSGGQRCILPPEATHAIIERLGSNQSILLHTKRVSTEVSAVGFSQFYKKIAP